MPRQQGGAFGRGVLWQAEAAAVHRPILLPPCLPACLPAALPAEETACLPTTLPAPASPPCLPPCPALALQTICFEGHDPLIVAADNMPIQPIRTSSLGKGGCIDLNSGQR